MDNRRLDEGSRTAGYLEREFIDLASLPVSRLEQRLAILSDFELATFFGAMPGAAVELSIDGGADHQRLLPESGKLAAAALKTLTRLGDDGFVPSGLVYRHRAETIADRIPTDASIEDMSRFMASLICIVMDASDGDDRKERRIRSIMDMLLTIGSLGSATVHSAITDRFSCPGLDEKATFVTGITLPCMEDAKTAGITAHALATSVFHGFLEYSRASERRSVLILFARISPKALLCFARVPAGRFKLQHRFGNAARAARRDARRWHEAHAGWKLIDDVLEAVWPDAGKKLGSRQRDAVFAIVVEIVEFIGPGRPDRIQSPQRRQQRDGVWETDDVANVANISVNREHIGMLASLRSAVHKLDIVLRVLDRRALFELEPKISLDPYTADLRGRREQEEGRKERHHQAIRCGMGTGAEQKLATAYARLAKIARKQLISLQGRMEMVRPRRFTVTAVYRARPA